MKGKMLFVLFLPIVIQAQSVKNGVKARALIEKAYAANAANSYQEALTYFIQADSLSSAVFTSDDYNNMGGSYFKLGEYRQAIAMSKRSLLLDSNNIHAFLNMGIAYGMLDSHLLAIECYQKVVLMNPTQTQAYFNMALSYQQLKEKAKALEVYQKIIEIEPDNAKAFINMGIVYGELGNYKKLVECYQQAARLGNKVAQDYLSKSGHGW